MREKGKKGKLNPESSKTALRENDRLCRILRRGGYISESIILIGSYG